jgi:hypothetical protein
MGRPSCQSSLLSDPNANFSVEMWRKSNMKEGRHVGLDFYDLLIEGHYPNSLPAGSPIPRPTVAK